MKTTELLISVQNADEAMAALAGGADWIDVKDPRSGPLGAASARVVEAVVRIVAGRKPVSLAAGELLDWSPVDWKLPDVLRGVCLVKLGLANCNRRSDWVDRYCAIRASLPKGVQTAIAAYADHEAAQAPPLSEVARVAVATETRAVLMDTWDKESGRTLLDVVDGIELKQFVNSVRLVDRRRAHTRSLPHACPLVALAGSLAANELAAIAQFLPDLVGVRGAACRHGRQSAICPQRVALLRAHLRHQQPSPRPEAASS